ncbi:MAG TPA: hypothetical protein DEH22_04705 [Chloroflexi bacterium]|nr:hypothetical protein [Chloroflexota bacterium]
MFNRGCRNRSGLVEVGMNGSTRNSGQAIPMVAYSRYHISHCQGLVPKMNPTWQNLKVSMNF